MRVAGVVLALAVLVASLAGAETVAPAEVWRPMHWFIGTWKGTRTGADASKVTRVYASATTNHHLEVTETAGGRKAAVWGVVSFDAQRQGLVLRQFGPDGSTVDVTLDPAASQGGPVVFASGESDTPRTRITYERTGSKTFVERIERASAGEPFAVVSEAHFERKN